MELLELLLVFFIRCHQFPMAFVSTRTIGRVAAASFLVSGVVYLLMRSSGRLAAGERSVSTAPATSEKSVEKARYLVAGYDSCGYFQRTVSVLQALEKAADNVNVEVHGGSRSEYKHWVAAESKVDF